MTPSFHQAFVRETRHPAPQDWKDENYPSEKGDHPAVYISWHDAMAYCQWISENSGKKYRLPTEAEWEKAARGENGWIYPWGNDWDEKKVNSGEGGPGGTTPVGQYSPGGDSPYGLADMAGNVWEWTQSLWGKAREKPEFRYPYDPQDSKREDLKAGNEVARVLRGGSFDNLRYYMRCAVRLGYDPGGRFNLIGFRVVLSPTASEP
jgi:formylglycine-generating enzyme required for sulfatase activity